MNPDTRPQALPVKRCFSPHRSAGLVTGMADHAGMSEETDVCKLDVSPQSQPVQTHVHCQFHGATGLDADAAGRNPHPPMAQRVDHEREVVGPSPVS
jgi:hypothetical protein